MPASPPGAGRLHGTGNRGLAITWGAQDVLSTPALLATQLVDSQQLVFVANEIPESFTLSLVAQVLEGTFSGAGQVVAVEFDISYGAGAARITVPFFFNFDSTLAAPVENYRSLSTPFALGYKTDFVFPASQLNVVAKLATSETTVKTTVKVSATAAPRFKLVEDREHAFTFSARGG